MKDFIDDLKRLFYQRPVEFCIALGILLTAISKIVMAYGNAQGSRAYAKQVNYRVKHGL